MATNIQELKQRAFDALGVELAKETRNYTFVNGYITGAEAQDRISRQEERERCIREAMNAYCGRCSFYLGGECKHKSLVGVETECGKRIMKVREAIEKGGDQ